MFTPPAHAERIWAAGPVAKAADAVGTHAVLLARARDQTAAARNAPDAAIAEVDGRIRQLGQAAAERRMPTAAQVAVRGECARNASGKSDPTRYRLSASSVGLGSSRGFLAWTGLSLSPNRRRCQTEAFKLCSE